jgi:hypothetical protein
LLILSDGGKPLKGRVKIFGNVKNDSSLYDLVVNLETLRQVLIKCQVKKRLRISVAAIQGIQGTAKELYNYSK